MVRHRSEERGVTMGVNLSDGSWTPIPHYEGYYWINPQGEVCNIDGHKIKPIESKSGLRVELRKNGQRETLLIVDILEGISHENA